MDKRIVANEWISKEPLMEARVAGQEFDARSDGEVQIAFESAEDAQALYAWVTGVGTGVALLQPGEVTLTVQEQSGQYTLSFLETVVLYKPEIVQAIIEAYEDGMDEALVDEAMDRIAEAYEALADDRLEEKRAFNPYHDVNGNFTSPEQLTMAKKGSFSKGKRRNKVSGKTKKALKLVATKLPCGRAARQKGKDVRCWDGKNMGWSASAAARMAKKTTSRSKGEAVQWSAHDRVMSEKLVALFDRRMDEACGKKKDNKNKKINNIKEGNEKRYDNLDQALKDGWKIATASSRKVEQNPEKYIFAKDISGGSYYGYDFEDKKGRKSKTIGIGKMYYPMIMDDK